MVQQLRRIESQRQISQTTRAAPETEIQTTGDVLDRHAGTGWLSKDHASENRTSIKETINRSQKDRAAWKLQTLQIKVLFCTWCWTTENLKNKNNRCNTHITDLQLIQYFYATHKKTENLSWYFQSHWLQRYSLCEGFLLLFVFVLITLQLKNAVFYTLNIWSQNEMFFICMSWWK